MDTPKQKGHFFRQTIIYVLCKYICKKMHFMFDPLRKVAIYAKNLGKFYKSVVCRNKLLKNYNSLDNLV